MNLSSPALRGVHCQVTSVCGRFAADLERQKCGLICAVPSDGERNGRESPMLWKNYFAAVQEQLRFNGRGTHATSIQEPADSDSILAGSRHSTEFFHSIRHFQTYAQAARHNGAELV